MKFWLQTGYVVAFMLNMIAAVGSVGPAMNGDIIHISILFICFFGCLYSLIEGME